MPPGSGHKALQHLGYVTNRQFGDYFLTAWVQPNDPILLVWKPNMQFGGYFMSAPHVACLEDERAIWGLFFLLAWREKKQRKGRLSNLMFPRSVMRNVKTQNLIMPRRQLPGKPSSAITQTEAIGKPPNPQSGGGLGLAVNSPDACNHRFYGWEWYVQI